LEDVKQRPSLIVTSGENAVVVSGLVSISTDTGEIKSIYTIQSTVSVAAPTPGTYAIRFEGDRGQVLATYSFEPEKSNDDSMGSFALLLPWNSNTYRIALLHNGREISARRGSNNAPVVTVNYPNGGETLRASTATLRWSAADQDGDPLTFAVQYSKDAGASWQTIVTDWPSTTYDLNLNAITGSERALVRVLALDGVHTSKDESDATFVVTKHAPIVTIKTPANNSVYLGEQTVILEGEAYDNEDGQLNDTALTWSSNRNGVLGTGRSIPVNASSLGEGAHTITLTARDRDGEVSSTTINLQVSRTSPARILGASVIGKKLVVNGENFSNGAIIVVNGQDKPTVNDAQSPTTTLISKKAGKKIKVGQSIVLQVRNSNGVLSNEFLFIRN
jgi:hypothetical protein